MLGLNYSNFKNLTWVNWLDPLSHVNKIFDQKTFRKIEFDKINFNLNRSEIIKNLSYAILCKKKFIKETFEIDSNGINYVGLNTKLTDNLIENLFDH